MIQQSNLDHVNRQLREEYLTVKGLAINAIVLSYLSSARHVGKRLVDSPYSKDVRARNLLFSDLNQAFAETSPSLNDSFDKNLQMISGKAVYDFETKTKFSGLGMNSYTMNKALALPKSVSIEQIGGNYQISNRLWGVDQRAEVLQMVSDGLNGGKTPFQIAEEIEEYSITGNGHFNATRLAYTETTRAYERTNVETTRYWNTNPERAFDLVIIQSLAPTHEIYDICDVLAGTYDPNGIVPEIPRHAFCNCIQTEEMVEIGDRSRTEDVRAKLQQANEANPSYKKLKKAGIKVEPNKQGMVDGKMMGSQNRYNHAMEQISKAQGLTKEEKKELYQALIDITPSQDPLGKTIKNFHAKELGIKPTPNTEKFYDPNLVSYYDRQYRDLNTGQAIVQNGQLDSFEKNFLTSRGVTLDKTPLTDPRFSGGYDATSKTISLQADASPRTLHHEVGHAIDQNYFDDETRLSHESFFTDMIYEKGGTLNREGNAILRKRVEETEVFSDAEWGKFVNGEKARSITHPDQDSQLTGNLEYYMKGEDEMFAEAYSLYKTDPNFKQYAPEVGFYFDSLLITP